MTTALDRLPTNIKARLDELEATLAAALDTDLVAMLVYGSAARGDYREGESDVDVLLVLENDDAGKLAALGPALQLARFSARIEVLMLRRDEVPNAADCFPLLYDDVARHSIVVRGKSPFEGMRIEGEHKRLRIEQELREARIRMRRVATDMGGDPTFGRAVERKIKQVRGPLWALLALKGLAVEDRLDPVIDAAAKTYEVDPAPLRRAREDARAAYDALAKLLDRALVDVDRFGQDSGQETRA